MCRRAEGSTLGWGAPRQREERPGAMGREAKHLLSITLKKENIEKYFSDLEVKRSLLSIKMKTNYKKQNSYIYINI